MPKPRLTTEFHYTDGDVGAHPASSLETAIWENFFPSKTHRPTHILIRPDTKSGQRLSNQLQQAATVRKALQDMVAIYGRLHDGLSDMIDTGRLTAADIPDDYGWLVELLANSGNRAIQRAKSVLNQANAGLSAPTKRRQS
jgi:hypothetical protein